MGGLIVVLYYLMFFIKIGLGVILIGIGLKIVVGFESRSCLFLYVV